MGISDFFTEPHKTIKSVFIILSFFFLAKFFVFLFDGVDGSEDGKINVGTCPNIPIVEKMLKYSLNLISLDCSIEGGLSYKEIEGLIGENYTIEDALRNRVFRTTVPFIEYFADDPEKLNDYFVGLKGEKVYQLSNKEFIFSVWNDKVYYIKGYLGTLLGGAVITEVVFDWPGLGQLLVDSIQRRDYPVVQACILIISVAYITINGLTEMVYAWLDPRIRLAR